MTHIDYSVKQKVLKENKDHYNSEYADQYDDIHPIHFNHYSQKVMRREIKSMLSQLTEKSLTVLDVGSGTGNFTLNVFRLAPKNIEISAVDIAEKMLDKLITKVSAEFTAANLKKSVSDIESFLLQNHQKYHIVGFASAIHHFPDYLAVVCQCAKIVENKGFLYIHQEPLHKNNVSTIGHIINYIDTRAYFCFHVFKKEGIPFYIRWAKFLKAMISPIINKWPFFRSITVRLGKSRHFHWLYNDGAYSNESLRYVEFHEEGLDIHAIINILKQEGLIVQMVDNAPDKHYKIFFWLSKIFRASSHFSLIAKKG